jgi:predicted Zn-dependent protease
MMSGMKKIGPPHSHVVAAAEGWLGLGNPAEAKAELARLPGRLHGHPEVLRLMWDIAAREHNWPLALDIARLHMSVAPKSLFGWIHQAYALRRVEEGGLQAAWNALFPVMEKFPKNPIVPYNLACYACQLQQQAKARILLTRAMALGGREENTRMALNDSDLKPLWDLIKGL